MAIKSSSNPYWNDLLLQVQDLSYRMLGAFAALVPFFGFWGTHLKDTARNLNHVDTHPVADVLGEVFRGFGVTLKQ
jgi:hypothetical protein